MINPAQCHCGSISWERNIKERRYTCCSCKRPLWQPIETAPEDEMILVWADDGWVACAEFVLMSEYGGYDEDDGFEEDGNRMWVNYDGAYALQFDPTHWMPLPEAPGND